MVLITFFTSYFRLAMNKRFYDLAKLTIAHDYLIIKSYYTQFFLVIYFAIVAIVAKVLEHNEMMLEEAYWFAVLATPIFLWYGAGRYRYEQKANV